MNASSRDGHTPRIGSALRVYRRQHSAIVHQRNAIAARSFIHEVCRDKDSHILAPRQVDQDLPELIPSHRIDTRCRLIEDQNFRLVDDCDSERQPLSNAQRQTRRKLIEIVRKPELADQLGDPRICLVSRN